MIFLNSASSAAALVFYLPLSGPSMKPGVHSEEKTEYTLKFSKQTLFNEHPVPEIESLAPVHLVENVFLVWTL